MTKVQQIADFTNKHIFVGIDVHKKSWSVTLYYVKNYLRTFSQPPSVQALERLLRRDYPGAEYLCGYESGFCGFWIQRELQQKGIGCYVVHTADIPRTQKHKTVKNDTIDSQSIAQSLSAGLVKSIYVPDPQTEGHRSLLRHRDRLLTDIRRCKNRIRSFLYQFGYEIPENYEKSWSNKFILWLKTFDISQEVSRITLNHMIEQLQMLRESLLKVNKSVRALQKCDQYSPLVKTLLSVPGVGPLTALTLVTEIADMSRFGSFRQLNSFVGLYAMEFSSGEHEYTGNITIRHNHYLRKAMVEAAWIAIRYDPALLLAFEAWKTRMTAKRAIVKIARKLLNRIRYIWLNKTIYVTGIV